MNKWIVLLLLIHAEQAAAQPIEMADAMHSNGKIYAVLAVVLIIFAVLILYLIRIEKKLIKLEGQINSNNLNQKLIN